MAENVYTWLEKILSAKYGEDVREAIYNSISVFNTTLNDTASKFNQDAASVAQAKTDTIKAKNDAVTAKTQAEAAKTAAQTAQTNAVNAADLANRYQTQAMGFANQAEAAKTAAEKAKTDTQTLGNTLKTELTNQQTAAVKAVNDTKTSAITAITTQQTTSINAVKTQETTSKDAVKSQQTTSINAVKAEQTTALKAVDDAKNDALQDIGNAVDDVLNGDLYVKKTGDAISGVVTAPTPASNANAKQIVTKEYVDNSFFYALGGTKNVYPSGNTNYYYEIASCDIRGTYNNQSITFLVSAHHYGAEAVHRNGILSILIRADGNVDFNAANVEWLIADSNLNPDNFILCYDDSSSDMKVRLFMKSTESHVVWFFEVLDYGDRASKSFNWTLYKNDDYTKGISVLPSGYRQIISKHSNIWTGLLKVQSNIHMLVPDHLQRTLNLAPIRVDDNTVRLQHRSTHEDGTTWDDTIIGSVKNAVANNDAPNLGQVKSLIDALKTLMANGLSQDITLANKSGDHSYSLNLVSSGNYRLRLTTGLRASSYPMIIFEYSSDAGASWHEFIKFIKDSYNANGIDMIDVAHGDLRYLTKNVDTIIRRIWKSWSSNSTIGYYKLATATLAYNNNSADGTIIIRGNSMEYGRPNQFEIIISNRGSDVVRFDGYGYFDSSFVNVLVYRNSSNVYEIYLEKANTNNKWIDLYLEITIPAVNKEWTIHKTTDGSLTNSNFTSGTIPGTKVWSMLDNWNGDRIPLTSLGGYISSLTINNLKGLKLGKNSHGDRPTLNTNQDTSHKSTVIFLENEKGSGSDWSSEVILGGVGDGYSDSHAVNFRTLNKRLSGISVGANNAGAHNGIFRGNNIGSTVTTAQWAAIYNGTFENLYIGDYWQNGSIKYRIAGFDYFYTGVGTGYPHYKSHHVVIVRDDTNGSGAYESTADGLKTKGYNSSTIKARLANEMTGPNSFFGSAHIMPMRLAVSTKTNDSTGQISTAVGNFTCALMTQAMVVNRVSPCSYWADSGQICMEKYYENTILPLFNLAPYYISIATEGGMRLWLRDIDNDGSHAFYIDTMTRMVSTEVCTSSLGVRPYFCIYSATAPASVASLNEVPDTAPTLETI